MLVVSIGCGYTVAPLVGAWIEFHQAPSETPGGRVAPLVGAWIEIELIEVPAEDRGRRSSRGSVD